MQDRVMASPLPLPPLHAANQLEVMDMGADAPTHSWAGDEFRGSPRS